MSLVNSLQLFHLLDLMGPHTLVPSLFIPEGIRFTWARSAELLIRARTKALIDHFSQNASEPSHDFQTGNWGEGRGAT